MTIHPGLDALTEREKQTLRLIVRGHDAKSAARTLGLSVHTINERLREARRKLTVSSSREAARLLLAAEAGEGPASDPESMGDKPFGGDGDPHPGKEEAAPGHGAAAGKRRLILAGVCVMTFALGLLALTSLTDANLTHVGLAAQTTTGATPSASDRAVVEVAQAWLALLDAGDWDASYAATGTAFRQLNTPDAWAQASRHARVPLGAVQRRVLATVDLLPAPPAGYTVVRFTTRFANRAQAVETVSLDRDDGAWRVVGVTID